MRGRKRDEEREKGERERERKINEGARDGRGAMRQVNLDDFSFHIDCLISPHDLKIKQFSSMVPPYKIHDDLVSFVHRVHFQS